MSSIVYSQCWIRGIVLCVLPKSIGPMFQTVALLPFRLAGLLSAASAVCRQTYLGWGSQQVINSVSNGCGKVGSGDGSMRALGWLGRSCWLHLRLSFYIHNVFYVRVCSRSVGFVPPVRCGAVPCVWRLSMACRSFSVFVLRGGAQVYLVFVRGTC